MTKKSDELSNALKQLTEVALSTATSKLKLMEYFENIIMECYPAEELQTQCPLCSEYNSINNSNFSIYIKNTCKSCKVTNYHVYGVIVSKRYNYSSDDMEDWGLHLRYKNKINDDSYIHIMNARGNIELRSKDQFIMTFARRGKKFGVSIYNFNIKKSYIKRVDNIQYIYNELFKFK